MNYKQGAEKNGRSTTTNIMIGVVLTISVTILLSAAAATLVLSGFLDETKLKLAAYSIMFLSVFSGATISSRKTDAHIAIVDAAITAIYMFLLVAINIVVFSGSFSHLWIGLAVVLTAATTSMLFSAKGIKHKTRRYKQYR